jgi:RNA polymerase sigma-70 factor (ECF subfamily)
VAGSDPLAPIVEQARTEARARWPEISIDAPSFLAYLRERHLANAGREKGVSTWHLGDLALAFACAKGDERALARFEREYITQVPLFLAGAPSAAKANVEEVCQVLRVRLLVTHASKPRGIAGYSGRGALGAWLRVAALRAAQDLVKRRREVNADSMRELRADGPTPEQAVLKRSTSRAFRGALEMVLKGLSAKDRNLLKMHFLDGMSTDTMATFYGVNGSTVRRWLIGVRAAVERETKRELAARLRLGPRELESMMAALESRMDVSISRFLKSER